MSTRWLWVLGIALPAGPAACREAPKPPPAQSAPAERPREPSPPETAPAPPATKPTPPATQASRPSPRKAVYEETPPFRVENVVLTPTDPQAGWLRIVEMARADAVASVRGEFPEPNRMNIESENVRRLTIDLDALPLKAKTRRILRIDEQPIELYQAHRGKILLERGSAGRWTVLTKPPR